MTTQDKQIWFDDNTDEDDFDGQIDEYDLTATPNDFNVLTIHSFIESGAVVIPGFQRSYVWDIKRASKLIESLILGLPVPQVFLYESGKNHFLVVDGQQRLMSIYYYMKGRFPKPTARSTLRTVALKEGRIPDDLLNDDDLFQNFTLSLPEQLPQRPNKFKGKKYLTLGDYKATFELRPVRNVIIKQNAPKDDDSSVYEIFNRLNTGGVNLQPQEIRASLYYSEFYESLHEINLWPDWRKLIGKQEPDTHAKDVEILLRAFALLLDSPSYKPSMVKFLNQFSRRSKKNSKEDNKYLQMLFRGFLDSISALPSDVFISPTSRRLNVALFESVFVATCQSAAASRDQNILVATEQQIRSLREDSRWDQAASKATTDKANVDIRIQRAKMLVGK